MTPGGLQRLRVLIVDRIITVSVIVHIDIGIQCLLAAGRLECRAARCAA